MSARPLTKAMVRELRSIERTGEPSDPHEWAHAPTVLWFHARDRVLAALLSRGLVNDANGWSLTDTGRAAISSDAGCQP